MLENQQPVLDYSSRTLLDVTPVRTPVQGTRDIPSHPLAVAMSTRVSTPEYASSRLALPSLKGVTRIYVEDQTHFKVGKIIIICELFMVQVTGFGSLALVRPLDRDYPAGSPIREVTPADDYVVDARGRTIINGVVMDSLLFITGQPECTECDNKSTTPTTTIRGRAS